MLLGIIKLLKTRMRRNYVSQVTRFILSRKVLGLSMVFQEQRVSHAIEALTNLEETMTQKEIDEEARELGGHYWVSH